MALFAHGIKILASPCLYCVNNRLHARLLHKTLGIFMFAAGISSSQNFTIIAEDRVLCEHTEPCRASLVQANHEVLLFFLQELVLETILFLKVHGEFFSAAPRRSSSFHHDRSS